MGNPLDKEPAVIGAAVVAVLNALVLLGLVTLTDVQVAGINIALVAVLGLFIRQNVFSKASAQKVADRAAATGKAETGSPP